MKPKYTENIVRLTEEIRDIARDLPPGKRYQIINRCSKINVLISKKNTYMDKHQQTSRQIADRYNARKAIYEAMTKGRHITLEDSMEFAVSQMHTTICFIRKNIEAKSLPYVMKDRWTDSRNGKRIKEYWLEERI